ncbi:MAG: polyphosphate kinase 2 family protein [Gloeobacterales cyanobacterium]
MNILVKPGTKVSLKDIDPDQHGSYSKDSPEVTRKLQEDLDSMSTLQERLYAESQQALLIVLQGMDTGGKDGTIKHVMTGLNPQGCNVVSFKAPTPEDLAHDFLWRIHPHVPAKGQITVFNRSHYEDVLIARVHQLVPEKISKYRYNQINEFEELLVESGTLILKFFLYISKDEQKRRLQERIDEPEKHWKLSPSDFSERHLWDQYIEAYEAMLSECNTQIAPWYIIPANHKWYRNMLVADVIEKTLRDMDPQWPKPTIDVVEFHAELNK